MTLKAALKMQHGLTLICVFFPHFFEFGTTGWEGVIIEAGIPYLNEQEVSVREKGSG